MEQEVRKPYYIIKAKRGYLIHPGYPSKRGGEHIILNLTDEEFNKYDRNKITELLKPYIDITNKRINYCPTELVIWAIEEVIYE
jgi:hypothetical protein